MFSIGSSAPEARACADTSSIKRSGSPFLSVVILLSINFARMQLRYEKMKGKVLFFCA